jgi:hypothetical protein
MRWKMAKNGVYQLGEYCSGCGKFFKWLDQNSIKDMPPKPEGPSELLISKFNVEYTKGLNQQFRHTKPHGNKILLGKNTSI